MALSLLQRISVGLTVSLVLLSIFGCTSYSGQAAPAEMVTEEEEDESFDEKVARQQEIIRRQELEKKRQQREIEDLRRQKYHNEALQGYERK